MFTFLFYSSKKAPAPTKTIFHKRVDTQSLIETKSVDVKEDFPLICSQCQNNWVIIHFEFRVVDGNNF